MNLDCLSLSIYFKLIFFSRACWKYNKNKCIFSYEYFFTLKTTTQPVEEVKVINQKNEILTWGKALLKKIKNYIDDHLNLTKKTANTEPEF